MLPPGKMAGNHFTKTTFCRTPPVRNIVEDNILRVKMATVGDNFSNLKKPWPPPRSGHVFVCTGRYLLAWGGYTELVRLVFLT